QPWIASPHNIHYVSQVRWRLRKDGLGEAQPCPGAMRRDGERGLRRARRGESTPSPTPVPAPCAVFASAAALTIRRTYRRAAIQCRSPQIRMFSPRHWIASHL
ncbi:MAG: hypothetical protein LBM98_03920, partial [Oscillospiraceae bacterium]|nr:hypothetical protein [Oscillospiraceae bacterium]